MNFSTFEVRRVSASLIFSPVDGYALDRAQSGPRPRPIGPLKYLLTAMTSGDDPKNPFRPLELVTARNDSGFDTFFDTARPATDPDRPGAFEPYRAGVNRARKVRLSPGRYAFRVVSQFYAPFFGDLTYPDPRLAPDPRAAAPTPPTTTPDFDPIILRPGPLYPFRAGSTTLRGVVQDQGGAGVAGALVSATGVDGQVYRTDSGGQWVLVFPVPSPPPKAPITTTVHVERPGGAVETVAAAVVVGSDNSVPLTALRGSVRVKGVGSRGASIRAGAFAATTGVDGGFTVVFPADGAGVPASLDVSATLADGRTLTESAFPVAPRATLIVPTFRFD